MTTFVKPVVEPEEEYKELVTPTWVTGFFLPLAQNLAGGVAVAAMGMIGVVAFLGTTATWIDLYNASIWCLLVGGVPACLLTVWRFWGDELGLFTATYRAGYADAQAALTPQINHLQLLLDAAYDAQNAVESEGGGATATMKKNQELMERARKDAATIIKVAFQGDSVARAAMDSRGMGRRDWERATNLLKASGAMNGDGIMVAVSPAQALQAIDERVRTDSQHADNFTPKW
jgi:hypothetical protein